MFKLLIADDEIRIREGLREVFDWNELGFSVIEVASNGIDALDISRKIKPDLCLIDINMPDLNGLELIDLLNVENPLGLNIIITGYDEFKYTSKAIKLGVFDYVLKPIEEPLLYQIVTKAIEKINKEQERRKVILLAEQQIERNMPVLRDRFLLDWLSGNLSEEEIIETLAFHNIQLQGKIGLVLVSARSEYFTEQAHYEKTWQINLFAIQEIISKNLNDFSPVLITVDQQDNIIAIINSACGERWLTISKVIENAISSQIMIKPYVSSSDIPDGFANVGLVYSNLLSDKDSDTGYNSVVKKVIDYIKLNYQRPDLSLGAIADEFGWSLGHLSRIFKKETGLSFVEFLIKLRISEAVRLLLKTDLKIYEISEKVGYSSQHYFCAGFKKSLGVSPSDYRNKQ